MAKATACPWVTTLAGWHPAQRLAVKCPRTDVCPCPEAGCLGGRVTRSRGIVGRSRPSLHSLRLAAPSCAGAAPSPCQRCSGRGTPRCCTCSRPAGRPPQQPGCLQAGTARRGSMDFTRERSAALRQTDSHTARGGEEPAMRGGAGQVAGGYGEHSQSCLQGSLIANASSSGWQHMCRAVSWGWHAHVAPATHPRGASWLAGWLGLSQHAPRPCTSFPLCLLCGGPRQSPEAKRASCHGHLWLLARRLPSAALIVDTRCA